MSMEWEPVGGYPNTNYTDDVVFEVDSGTKLLQNIDKQIMVSGEEMAQFIRFVMDRYYDGIDLSEKNLQIIYITENGHSDINLPCSVERNDKQIRFGWVVPAAACQNPGTLSFSIEAVGDDYVWKTRTYYIEVYAGLDGGEIIPAPEEKAWYIELQERCDFVLSRAAAAQEAASGSADGAAESEANALSYKTDAQLSKEAAATSETNAAASERASQTHAQQAGAAKDAAAGSASSAAESEANALAYKADAQLSKEAAAASEASAKDSEKAAEQYAEQAGAVFKVAGDVSFTIGADKGVTMIFTEGNNGNI